MKQKGMTLVELMTAMSFLTMIGAAAVTLLITGMKSLTKTSADADLSSSNANGIRWVTNSLHNATSVTVSNNGTVITYQLPKVSATADPLTGSYELIDPITPDGVNRTFTVNFAAGTLTDSTTAKVLVRNIVSKDPQTGSSLYNATYVPFTSTKIGSLPAITINLITQINAGETTRFVRLKTTGIYHN